MKESEAVKLLIGLKPKFDSVFKDTLIKQANEIVKCLADNGLEFEPEELSAVEKWREQEELFKTCETVYTKEFLQTRLLYKVDAAIDELQAGIERLKIDLHQEQELRNQITWELKQAEDKISELETPHEDKAIEPESRMIGKKPYVESPELIVARDDYNSIPHAESSIEYQYVLNLERSLKELTA